MILAVEVELAVEHLEAHGMVTDLVAPSLADPEEYVRLLAELDLRRGPRASRLISAFMPRHGTVWALPDGPPRGRVAEVAAIRLAVEEGAMAPVWTRTGV